MIGTEQGYSLMHKSSITALFPSYAMRVEFDFTMPLLAAFF